MTALTNGQRAPFDLNAARVAARSEAVSSPFEFTFGPENRQFVINPKEMPMNIQALLSDGDFAGALAPLLGDDWQAFLDLSPTFGDLERLMNGFAAHAGLGDLGNSDAPPTPDSTLT